MGSSNYYYFIFSEIIVVVAVAASICLADDAYVCTRATFYGSPDCSANPTGACGFGEYGRTVNNGVVGGVSRLYRNGSGCGACYQVRCKIPTHCSEEGTEVVVTDYGEGHYTDFVLSERAYGNLARPNMAAELFGYGVVDVEYRRIPCRYTTNLKIKVHERSHFPSYLAILPIYQSGMYDITAVQIWQEDCKEWREMRRVYGAVWDMQNPWTEAAISLRIQVVDNANANVKWAQLAGVIAADWKAGVAYDATLQLN
ncbi:expansin-like B1 [Perilla frutescens var. hirtella]|uniref:Expansin-like B1 n=1 Tax=Perilla frutescens var. hirtella TaxID=608512 RepID=A0AAD4IXY1_PERFH|nr:expansin-like B1 [Perilla frutescens var. frutescens]KAH6787364.1 expansin-like B1 [Perilla frutescens var. hirtella]KAH6823462.1 expansin-like B1 [Perilla frutescens var. hirtella]